MTDELLYNFAQSLKRFVDLQHLSLNIASCDRITPAGIQYLRKSLKTLRNLQSFSLTFPDSDHVTDLELKSIIKALKACSFVKDIAFAIA